MRVKVCMRDMLQHTISLVPADLYHLTGQRDKEGAAREQCTEIEKTLKEGREEERGREGQGEREREAEGEGLGERGKGGREGGGRWRGREGWERGHNSNVPGKFTLYCNNMFLYVHVH